MEKENNYSLIAARHAKRFKKRQENLGPEKRESPDYPGLTLEGVEEAKVKAVREILPIVENGAPGSVTFLAAVSELERTRSTANVFSDTIAAEISGKESDILLISQNEIRSISAEEKLFTRIVSRLKQIIDENKDKKIIIDFPIFLKGLSMAETKRRKGLITLEKSEDGGEIENLTPGANDLYKTKNYDEAEFLKTLVESGKEKDLDPKKIALGFQESINRGVDFFRQRLDVSRHLNVISVGSSGWMEWLAVYLANKGRIDQDSLQETFSGKNMAETEFYVVDFKPDKVEISIRDKKFSI
jgi:hypothetical protein